MKYKVLTSHNIKIIILCKVVMIIPFYKQIGELMIDVLNRFDKIYKTKRKCFAGRLDPIAFGIVYILTDDDVIYKEIFCSFRKIYKFKLIHGIKTDTFDILGLITNVNQDNIDTTNLIIPNDYVMEYPQYSSYKIKNTGKPYWYCTMNNIKIDEKDKPMKNVTVYNFQICEQIEIYGKELLKLIKNKIGKVKKQSFRQKEIVELWEKNINFNDDYFITSYKIELSSGGYVRYFGNYLGGTCYDIQRIHYKIQS